MNQAEILKKTRAKLTVHLAGVEMSCEIEFLSEKQPSLHMQRESDEAYAHSIAASMIEIGVEILE